MGSIAPKKEEIPQENKEMEPILEKIGKTYEPLLPTWPKTSQNSSSITRSRAKAQMEKTSESREEECEKLTRKGRKPNKYHREQETAKEKTTCKQSSLDHLVKPLHPKKQSGEQTDGRKDRVGSTPIKK